MPRTRSPCPRTPSPALGIGRTPSTATLPPPPRRGGGGQPPEELPRVDYQAYAYLQTAQDEAVRRLVESLPEIALRFNPGIVISGAAPPTAGYFALAAIPARYALERQDWKAAAALQVRETPFPYTEAMTYFSRGLAWARLGSIESARASREALTKIHERLKKSDERYWADHVES